MRYVIVHYHIFKNGGSTIESVLEREFGPRFAELHGPEAESTLDGGDLAAFLEAYPEVAAVSSHHLRYPKPEVRRTVLFDCCFLRDPLSRLHSLYTYFKRIAWNGEYSSWARRYSPREFMMRLIEEAPHQASDVQVNELANAAAFTRPPGEDDLERAAALFRNMAMPGLVDMFDESLVSAEYYLKPAFPGIRLDYIRQNVSAPNDGDGPDLAGLWGAEVHDRLARMNRMDLELVRRARQEIARRLETLPAGDERLAEFRMRCARRAAARRASESAGVPATGSPGVVWPPPPGAPVWPQTT
jgi:hypothetical protein